MSSKAPLGRVLGLGVSSGTHHWWLQRVSSLALVILGPWFVLSLLGMPDFALETVRGALMRPAHALLTVLFIAVTAHHSWLGVTVVVEDYIPRKAVKMAVLLALQALHVVCAAGAIFAVLKVAFGSGA
jgi:succinate dehydrogenase / fumarate reductase, membrane anchor subunit